MSRDESPGLLEAPRRSSLAQQSFKAMLARVSQQVRAVSAGGHASPGTPWRRATTWRFADGTGAGGSETYLLLANVSDQPATVTLTYRRSDGTVIGTDG